MADQSSPFPHDWEALGPLVDQLLDTPPDQRSVVYAAISGDDPLRRAELERLVAECERESLLLDQAAVDVFPELLRDDVAPPLPDVLGDRYQIVRELGRGGMARVYLAQDVKHGRPVAVKVIRPELAATLGRRRFLHEIEIAARLRHPNIMPLFDSGDADGVLYFVMPYEDGLSLRARLQRNGRLSTADGVSVLRDVARALAYAHEHGVVHRDVKPDNVLLSSDAAVVTDFGIAKAFNVALSETDGGIHAEGVIGTPAYMAPEQARGDAATDHRADVYSFGCLAYEVFTGESPFAGSTTLELIEARSDAAPVPRVEARSDIPATLAEMIARCLEKDPAARPQSAAELLEVLDAVRSVDGVATPVPRGRKIVGFTIAVLVVAALVGWYVASRPARGGPVTVAVLPMLTNSADSAEATLAEGLSDELATALVGIPWVRVMSRRGADNFRGKTDIDHRATGKALGARYLVTGSLREIDGRQSITARLVNSEDGSVLWADEFERPKELAELRDRIVTAIGDSLKSKAGRYSARETRAPAATHRANNDAYILYVIGKRELNQRNQDLKGSIAHFTQAIALDSLSAEAWSGLSLALALSPIYHGASADSLAPIITANARRALRLDSRLAWPHIALGLVLQRNLQWNAAAAEFEAAVGIDPHDVEARVQLGRLLMFRGKLADGHRELELAREDDPASALVLSLLSLSWYVRGEMDSALVESRRALQSNPANLTTVCFSAMILSAVGRQDEARQLLAGFPPFNPMGAYVLAAAGDTGTVRQRLASAARNPPGRTWMPQTFRAFGMLGLRDTTEALDALERATDAREIWPALHPASGRMFDGVRESARFRALLARVGLANQ